MSKNKIKNYIAIIICGLLLLSFPVQSFALDKNVDTEVIANNIAYISDWIDRYGYVNADGEKTIGYDPKAGTTVWVKNTSNCLEFDMRLIEDDNTNTFVYMYVDLPYSESVFVKVNVYLVDSNDNATGGVMSYATIDPSDYDWNEEDTYFSIDNKTVDERTAQQWCNWSLNYAMGYWDELLDKKMEMSVVDLGFSKFCNHDWSGETTVFPTKTAEGEEKYTCNWCGLIEYESIPADTWSAKGKTVSLKASTLKKKTVSVASKKCFTLKNCEYRDLSYKKLKGNSKITINSKTGKITVKKGLKKGTYKVIVNVKSKASDLYEASSKKVTITVKVK